MIRNMGVVFSLVVVVFMISCHNKDFSNPADAQIRLTAPPDLKTSPEGEWIKLSWQKHADIIDGYEIERKKATEEFGQLVVINDANWTCYTDTTIQTDIAYSYRLRGFSGEKKSVYTDPVTFTVNFPIPYNLKVMVLTDTSINLSWQDSCSFELGFDIERQREGAASWHLVGQTAADETNITDTGLVLEVNYLYRVRAFSSRNHSQYSSNRNVSSRVKDIDGNVYQTVKIGNQLWMAENLKVTHYRNGNPIPRVTSAMEWENLSSGAYCEYDNNTFHAVTYGRLYNWFAVDNLRGLAPEGWHVPTDEEWQTLIEYLGGDSMAGGKMKVSGTQHWLSPNTGATNSSGYSALPGGCRHGSGSFLAMGYYAYFWSTRESSSYRAWNRILDYDLSKVLRSHFHKVYGFSVRCVRD